MARIVRVKNALGVDKTYAGKVLTPGSYIQLTDQEVQNWQEDQKVFAAIANGDLIVNKGSNTVDDIPVGTQAWKWFIGETSPISEVGNKIWVHQSSKPEIPGRNFFICWTGAGDDYASDTVGAGEPLLFDVNATDSVCSKDIYFDLQSDDMVYIHEGYFMWQNAGWGDTINVDVTCRPTPLQQVAQLDLELDGDRIKFSSNGPGGGTHGFAGADTVYLVKNRTQEGYWNYDAVNGLQPAAGDGKFDIFQTEVTVAQLIHKIPVFGTSQTFACLQSSDTALLAPGYFLRIYCENTSRTDWKAWMFMALHRDRTV